MKTAIALILVSFLSAPAALFGGSWMLIAPEFIVSEAEIAATKNWILLNSFATATQCNNHRSSLVRELDNERQELRSKDHSAPVETARELTLLLRIYTRSKCVSEKVGKFLQSLTSD